MAEGFDDQDQERFIISGVIDGVKQSFVDSGVDVEVLAKLEDLWLSKLRASSSHGLAIADVLEPPAAKRVKGKGKGKNRVPVIPKEEPVLEEEEEEVGERSKSDVIVISSDDSQEQELVNKPQTTKSKLSLNKKKKSTHKTVPQVDGPADSSDEEDGVDDDDDDGDDDDDDDDDDNDPDGEDDEGVEEEPLGSEDDISDEDASDLFDTENVVVCQFDKITRARNKWKFHLKDGIMNLNGKDYVFQRATGEAEW